MHTYRTQANTSTHYLIFRPIQELVECVKDKKGKFVIKGNIIILIINTTTTTTTMILVAMVLSAGKIYASVEHARCNHIKGRI